MINIDLKKDFNKNPFGRYITDGPNSGERFRKAFLLKNLNENDESICINLNSDLGLGSSFLTSAFSLIMDEIDTRTGKRFTYEYVSSRVEFIYPDDACVDISSKDVGDIWKWTKELEISIPENENKRRIKKMNDKARKMLFYKG